MEAGFTLPKLGTFNHQLRRRAAKGALFIEILAADGDPRHRDSDGRDGGGARSEHRAADGDPQRAPRRLYGPGTRYVRHASAQPAYPKAYRTARAAHKRRAYGTGRPGAGTRYVPYGGAVAYWST